MRTPPACAHGGAQGRDERLEAARQQRLRREAGQAPVLAARVEQIGRRADVQAEQQVLLARPGMAAARIHPDRKIGDQPDAHAGVARVLLHVREAARRDPLQEQVELDRAALSAAAKRATAGAVGARHSSGQSLQLHFGSAAPNQC